ncbi:hypothetical protein R1flu_012017 [Riccia fluitans]|uniref:Uncharacterized protein n=1 Tax=Riccia fluitans TaxID=41844 RepID=A0ABD1Z9E2_9MARC
MSDHRQFAVTSRVPVVPSRRSQLVCKCPSQSSSIATTDQMSNPKLRASVGVAGRFDRICTLRRTPYAEGICAVYAPLFAKRSKQTRTADAHFTLAKNIRHSKCNEQAQWSVRTVIRHETTTSDIKTPIRSAHCNSPRPKVALPFVSADSRSASAGPRVTSWPSDNWLDPDLAHSYAHRCSPVKQSKFGFGTQGDACVRPAIDDRSVRIEDRVMPCSNRLTWRY